MFKSMRFTRRVAMSITLSVVLAIAVLSQLSVYHRVPNKNGTNSTKPFGSCCGTGVAAERAPSLQRTGSASGVIDGSEYPELIPDARAFHALLITSSALDTDSEQAKRQTLAVAGTVVKSGQTDVKLFHEVANQYRASYLRLGAERSLDESAKTALLSAAVSTIKTQLTELGAAQFLVSAQAAKSRIKLHPLPQMNMPHQANLWDHLFSIQTVSAQGMTPYATTYSTQSGNGDMVQATSFTDASSSCYCHQTSVYLSVSGPSGTVASSSGLGGEFTQGYAEYTLTDADYTDGNIIATSTYYAYCPYVGVFLDTIVSDWMPLRVMRAYLRYDGSNIYHRCNPTGNCDILVAVGGGRPSFVLADITEINIKLTYLCMWKTVQIVDSCHSPDPKP
jgi:hypothetical protein